MNKPKLKLTVHQDAGHGWLEISYALVASLGIRNEISHYSFYDQEKQVFYLEEDCDGLLAHNALTKLYKVSYKHKDHGNEFKRLNRLPPVNTPFNSIPKAVS